MTTLRSHGPRLLLFVQSSSPARRIRAEQLGLALATGDLDWDTSRPPRLPEREREVHARDAVTQLGRGRAARVEPLGRPAETCQTVTPPPPKKQKLPTNPARIGLFPLPPRLSETTPPHHAPPQERPPLQTPPDASQICSASRLRSPLLRPTQTAAAPDPPQHRSPLPSCPAEPKPPSGLSLGRRRPTPRRYACTHCSPRPHRRPPPTPPLAMCSGPQPVSVGLPENP